MTENTAPKVKRAKVDFASETTRLGALYGTSPVFTKFVNSLTDMVPAKDAYKVAKKNVARNYRALLKVERLLSGAPPAPRKPRKAKESK